MSKGSKRRMGKAGAYEDGWDRVFGKPASETDEFRFADRIIPEITDPMGRHWEQPSRQEIAISSLKARMSAATMKKLPDYSCSQPSGVYPGKMWRSSNVYYKELDAPVIWWLRWFGEHEDPALCSNHSREIVLT